MFQCRPDRAWASVNLAELARNVVKFSNQSQQNMDPDLVGNPMILEKIEGYLISRCHASSSEGA